MTKPTVFNHQHYEDALVQIEKLKDENRNMEIHIRILGADLQEMIEERQRLKEAFDLLYVASKQEERWIHAEEQLPAETEEVIVTDGRHVWIDSIYCEEYTEEGEPVFVWDSGQDWIGTAWMPLPALPKWRKEGSHD